MQPKARQYCEQFKSLPLMSINSWEICSLATIIPFRCRVGLEKARLARKDDCFSSSLQNIENQDSTVETFQRGHC